MRHAQAGRAAFDEVLAPGAVAKICGVTPKEVAKWADYGDLKSFRTVGNHRRFYKSDVLRFIEARVFLEVVK